MRPTNLQYRSPKQKTPCHYDNCMTHQGHPLAFPVQTQGKSKKRSFPSEQRFRQYDQWARVTGNFVGPGTYNDHLSTYQIKQIPCAAIMKPNAALG